MENLCTLSRFHYYYYFFIVIKYTQQILNTERFEAHSSTALNSFSFLCGRHPHPSPGLFSPLHPGHSSGELSCIPAPAPPNGSFQTAPVIPACGTRVRPLISSVSLPTSLSSILWVPWRHQPPSGLAVTLFLGLSSSPDVFEGSPPLSPSEL